MMVPFRIGVSGSFELLCIYMIYKFKPKGKYKEMQIERMKKLRVLGDIPPVFPNGWFRIAETDDLKPKQVLPIVFMGKNFTLA